MRKWVWQLTPAHRAAAEGMWEMERFLMLPVYELSGKVHVRSSQHYIPWHDLSRLPNCFWDSKLAIPVYVINCFFFCLQESGSVFLLYGKPRHNTRAKFYKVASMKNCTNFAHFDIISIAYLMASCARKLSKSWYANFPNNDKAANEMSKSLNTNAILNLHNLI